MFLTRFLNDLAAEQRDVLISDDGAKTLIPGAAMRQVVWLEVELGERSIAVRALATDIDIAWSFEGIDINARWSTEISVQVVTSGQRQRYAQPQRQSRLVADVCRICGGSGHFGKDCPSPKPREGTGLEKRRAGCQLSNAKESD